MSAPRQAPDNYPTSSAEIRALVEVLAERRLSVKEMLAAMNLKDRENFMANYLNPAVKDGFVAMLYPDSPRHPRQKYLLTVKGLALYNSKKTF